MLVEGVFNGSSGPLYYPYDEIARSVSFWNGKPVVVYHPKMEHGGAAGHPETFNAQKIGFIFNSRTDRARLVADAWVDMERVFRVDVRVHDAVLKRRMMELSTGLFVDTDGISGEYGGVQFIATARNLIPDHLAVLPDILGACSIKHGAGFLRNSTVNALEPLALPAMF